MSLCRTLRWKADFEKSCLTSCFYRRGWKRVGDYEKENEWNVYWANIHSARYVFSPEAPRLRDDQLINHFPNFYELTRKDLLVKNIKRYRKETDNSCEFLPQTFVLPQEYALFVDTFRKNPNEAWIMKPSSKSRGAGIFIITKLGQIRKWASRDSSQDVYVVSKYIEKPFLVGGRKFDLRLYVLVRSYKPLKAYLYQFGFARFCHEKYSNHASDRNNHYIHLTNVSVQKHNDEYNENHGGKWSISNLKLYLQATIGSERTQQLFSEIKEAILHSLQAVQRVMINDKHCFECYGYDLLIDENLKPWLIEVNASPSLSATTESDHSLKTSLVHNIFSVLIPENMPNDPAEQDLKSKDRIEQANFEILADEEEVWSSQKLTGSGGSKSRNWR
mmetsp:Transcript_39763/g.64569  ORF Transcript_39763/g.64569 Transcript_39763/m.64569 type:complete len:389 (-) Transcript_39763:2230-3396(-)